MPKHSLVPLVIAGLLAALSGCSGEGGGDPSNAAEADTRLPSGIETATAVKTDGVPLGTVPGVVTLPPEARVAVTAPFPGAAVRIFVIEGQAVRQGQPLALVRAAEPVKIRGDLARSQAEFGLAEAHAKRMKILADEGIIAQARSDEAQAQLQQARASYTESRRMVSLAGAGENGMMTLSAPISGRVQHVGIETGGPVDGMAAPFVIENSAAYRVDLQLPERVARTVRPGMAIAVRLPGADAQAAPVEGAILSVAPSIDTATRSVMAKARIASAPGLVPGQNVSVTISSATTGSGVAVPASAVVQIGGEDHVFLRKGKSFVPHKVRVAAQAGGNAIVAEGLKPGDVVATSSVAELKAMTAE